MGGKGGNVAFLPPSGDNINNIASGTSNTFLISDVKKENS
jgi:hypothetical protein